MNELLVTFIILNIVNVIIQTVKSICTIKCGKVGAAVINAVAYGLYTVVTVYTLCELPLMLKALVVAVCNLIGVYVVKLIEEKARKDRLWKVESTFKQSIDLLFEVKQWAKENDVPIKWNELGTKYVEIDFFSESQKKSALIKKFVEEHNGKYFVTETKIL